jgi:PAS domain S-box-containing protein
MYALSPKETNAAILEYRFTTQETYVLGPGYKNIFEYDIMNEYVTNDFWEQKIHPDDKEYVISERKKFIEDLSQAQHYYEYRFLKANGTYTYVNDRLYIIREHTIAIRLISAISDITKQKEEEQRLKLLESVITNSNDAVMITEAFPLNEPGPRILYVNEAMTKMAGYSKDEIIGRTPRMFQGARTDRAILDKLKQAITDLVPCKVEIINYSKNQMAYWVEIDVAPVFDQAGKPSHFIAIQRDVTDRKTQEQEKEKLILELVQNNKDLRQFSYITSHNLRAPIASLLGLTNLIDNYDIKDPVLEKILKGIKDSAYRFDETIRDLIEVLNIKDRPSIPKEEIRLSVVYDSVIHQCTDFINESGAVITSCFSEAPFINFNKAYLKSILLNLLTNAIKYRCPTKKLQIHIHTKNLIDNIILEFEDNGLGFDVTENKDKLFGLYQRFHENIDGKGIGLFLIKTQMESLNGTIGVKSNIGKGAIFTLTFKK